MAERPARHLAPPLQRRYSRRRGVNNGHNPTRQALAPQPDQAGIPGLRPMDWMRRSNPVGQRSVLQGRTWASGAPVPPLSPTSTTVQPQPPADPNAQRRQGGDRHRPEPTQQQPRQQPRQQQPQQAAHLTPPRDNTLAGFPKQKIRERITERIFGDSNFPMTPEFRAELAVLDDALERELIALGKSEREVESYLARAKAQLVDQYATQSDAVAREFNQAGLFGSGLMNQGQGSLNEAAFLDRADISQSAQQAFGDIATGRQGAVQDWRQGLIAALQQRAKDTVVDKDLYGTGVKRRGRRG